MAGARRSLYSFWQQRTAASTGRKNARRAETEILNEALRVAIARYGAYDTCGDTGACLGKSARVQSHCVLPEKDQSIRRPSRRASWAISVISPAFKEKSKIAAFSDSRRSLLVRGITTMSPCTRKRIQTCAAVLPCAAPIRAKTLSLRAVPRAIGL